MAGPDIIGEKRTAGGGTRPSSDGGTRGQDGRHAGYAGAHQAKLPARHRSKKHRPGQGSERDREKRVSRPQVFLPTFMKTGNAAGNVRSGNESITPGNGAKPVNRTEALRGERRRFRQVSARGVIILTGGTPPVCRKRGDRNRWNTGLF